MFKPNTSAFIFEFLVNVMLIPVTIRFPKVNKIIIKKRMELIMIQGQNEGS